MAGPLLDACGATVTPTASPSQSPSPHGRLPVTSKQLIFADFGGSFHDARRQVYLDPFEREYGVSVISTVINSDLYAKFVEGARTGKPTYDMWDANAQECINLVDQGLVQKLPPAVTRTDAVTPAKYREYCAGGYSYSIGMAFKRDSFGGRQPQTYADFFDTQRFPGKRSTIKGPMYMAEIALLADGVPADKLFPLDFERAFAKLAQLKGDLLFFPTYDVGLQYLTQGAATIVITSNARAQALLNKGENAVFQFNQALIYNWSGMPVPNGAPHADAMFALLDFMDQPERQAAFSKVYPYGPSNPKAIPLIDDATLKILPNSPEHLRIGVVEDLLSLTRQDDAYRAAANKFFTGT